MAIVRSPSTMDLDSEACPYKNPSCRASEPCFNCRVVGSNSESVAESVRYDPIRGGGHEQSVYFSLESVKVYNESAELSAKYDAEVHKLRLRKKPWGGKTGSVRRADWIDPQELVTVPKEYWANKLKAQRCLLRDSGIKIQEPPTLFVNSTSDDPTLFNTNDLNGENNDLGSESSSLFDSDETTEGDRMEIDEPDVSVTDISFEADENSLPRLNMEDEKHVDVEHHSFNTD